MKRDRLSDKQHQIVTQALAILDSFLRRNPVCLDAPDLVRDYLRLRLECQQREIFTVLYVNTKNQLIKAEDLFFGTLAETEVHPREVARQALLNNAAAVIVAHNHPSGCCNPSASDLDLTQKLKSALQLLNIRLLDHFIVGQCAMTSLAETGEL